LIEQIMTCNSTIPRITHRVTAGSDARQVDLMMVFQAIPAPFPSSSSSVLSSTASLPTLSRRNLIDIIDQALELVSSSAFDEKDYRDSFSKDATTRQ
jgi:hypothetical protein